KARIQRQLGAGVCGLEEVGAWIDAGRLDDVGRLGVGIRLVLAPVVEVHLDDVRRQHVRLDAIHELRPLVAPYAHPNSLRSGPYSSDSTKRMSSATSCERGPCSAANSTSAASASPQMRVAAREAADWMAETYSRASKPLERSRKALAAGR